MTDGKSLTARGTRIVIIDDHMLFREGLAALIRPEPDLSVVGMGGSVSEAVALVNQQKPEIILMDFNLPDGTGVDATKKILGQQPTCKIIFLTMSEEDNDLFAAIRAGAKGYMLKNIHPARLVANIRAVEQGESALSPAMTLRLMQEYSRTPAVETQASALPEQLTEREMDVLRFVARGLTNQEIATKLFISENTVKYHMHSILSKLGLPDRKSAAVYAQEIGLLP